MDVATHRVVRKGRVSAQVSKEGGHDMDKQDLNPLEDVKGAARYIAESHPLRAIKEALETGAELLEPSEADVRAMEIDTRSEFPVPGPMDVARPREAHPHPDSRELEREHPKA